MWTNRRHAAFVAGTARTGTVIWWQVGLGVVLLMLAAWLWRRAVRALQS